MATLFGHMSDLASPPRMQDTRPTSQRCRLGRERPMRGGYLAPHRNDSVFVPVVVTNSSVTRREALGIKTGCGRRRELRARQAGNCFWCGLPMTLVDDARHFHWHPWATTREHLLVHGDPLYSRPRSIVAAHQLCNTLRSRVGWDEFISLVQSQDYQRLYLETRMPRPNLTRILLKRLEAEAALQSACSAPPIRSA